MVEKRTCDYTGEEIEPGTGIMYVQNDGTVLHFVDSKAEKNFKLGREPRDLEWTEEGRRNKGPVQETDPGQPEPEEDDEDAAADTEAEPDADADAEDEGATESDADAEDEEAAEPDADDNEEPADADADEATEADAEDEEPAESDADDNAESKAEQ